MLLIVYNLPGNISYNDVKDLIKKNCGLDEVILDNLVNDKPGTKRVTVGLAEESDAAIFVRKINGMFIKGHQLFVENVRQKKASEQPYRTLASYLPDSGKDFSNPADSNRQQYNMPNQEYNMAHQYMNPYQSYFDVNMQYYMQQNPNTVVQSTSQAVQPMQPSLYQNNVPYYQQAQPQQFQQDVSSYQQKNIRISVTNTQYTQPTETLRKNDATPQQQQNLNRSFGDNNRQGKPNDRDWNGSGEVSYGRGDRRDEKKFNYERESKFDQNKSHSGYNSDFNRGFKNIGDKKDYSDYYNEAEGEGRSDNSKSGSYFNDRRIVVDKSDTEPDLRSRIDEKTRQKVDTRYDSKSVYREKMQARFTKKDVGPSGRTRSKGKFNTNFNQTSNTHGFDNDNRYVQSQGGNLKRKLETPQKQSKPKKPTNFTTPPKKFVAPPPPTVSGNEQSSKKKLKFSELDINKKLNRFNTWVHQVASDLAREVLKPVGGTPPQSAPIFAELKKCIVSRIFVIFDQRFAQAMPQIVKEYRQKYKKHDDYKFYMEVRDKVAEDAKKPGNELKSTPQTQQIPEGDCWFESTPGTEESTEMESAQQAAMSAQNKVSGPKEQAKNATPYINQLKPPTSGKLPSYPGGLDKKQYNELRLKSAEQFFEQEKIGQNLKEIDRKALKSEIEEFCKVVAAACEEVDKESGVESKHRWANIKKSIEKIVSVQVAERMSNSPSFLRVRVHFRPKKPNREMLEAFLKEYSVVSLKNSKRKNMFIAACSCFDGYDRLCALGEAVIDEKTLTFKPFHLCGPPLKGKLKSKYGKNQNNVEDGDDDEIDDDDDGVDDNDGECDDGDDEMGDQLENYNEEVSDHDKSVMIIEEKHDIIQLDDTDGAEPDNDEADQIEKDVNEICEVYNIGHNVHEKDSEIQNNDGNGHTHGKTNNDTNQSQEHNDLEIVDGINKKDTSNNESKNTQEIARDTCHDLIVGNDSYVVLDDADDDNKNDTLPQEAIPEVIQNADITEEDLEDF
ncbi:uncharacterized protein LOC119835977 [Zerene cesonia]|uniref:uncharacterized protein LOC119835977 n=1 Tax=Zerene cesonia TaxID=33412 RepID=UPI0018E59E67|nr:uncharacterized protein LOC119835977 [Zerene cesonia]